MPIYEFRCDECDKVKELLIMPSDIENMEVPECCGKLMVKTIGTINFKVKGHNAENGYSRKPSAIDNPPR